MRCIPNPLARPGRLLFAVAILAAAVPAFAQRFGDWQVDRNRELTIAVTQNESDSVLGYACARGTSRCTYFYMPDRLNCKEGGRYTLLLNGGRESSARSTTCTRLDWRDGHQFANVLDYSDALRNQLLNADGGTLGIARGTGADGFTISKFSMRGFRDAFERVNRQRDVHGSGGGPNRDYSTDRPQSGPGGVEFELFEHDNFQGRRLEGRGDINNLADVQFNDLVSSIIVYRGNWQLCTDAYFRGRCVNYGPGRHGSVGGNNDQFSSVRKLN